MQWLLIGKNCSSILVSFPIYSACLLVTFPFSFSLTDSTLVDDFIRYKYHSVWRWSSHASRFFCGVLCLSTV